ncbi:protein trapped in endoderm-1-like [Paramacrobiotus metropolitanus]|uniref:protein trapped in endoderm-1-like n=1 Tax=Paramacrobiotus metropolitanus TaxID=2943436 RepID=UPI0024455F77|nr:protein trapped in endoderm-1-like [Paramacrobiotus metropolitanus]
MWNQSNTTLHRSNASSSAVTVQLTIWFTAQLGLSLGGSALFMLLLLVMYRLNKLQTGSGLLIAHSLVIELVYCLLMSPITTIQAFCQYFQVPFYYNCRWIGFFLILILYTEHWSGVMLALNRFIAVLLPHAYKKVSSKKGSAVAMGFAWTMSFFLNLTTLQFIPGLQYTRQSATSCRWVGGDGVAFRIVGLLGTYIPIIIQTTCYGSLFLIFQVKKFRETPSANGGERPCASVQKRLAMTKALCFSFLWYCACILPPAIMTQIDTGAWKQNLALLQYSRTSQLLGYAISPVFFFAVNDNYRSALKQEFQRLSDSNIAGRNCNMKISHLDTTPLQACTSNTA